jgi:hypothetical protein
MKALASLIQTYVFGLPVAFGLATASYAMLIWLALSKKDVVKATIWHRTSGFSIEARSTRRRKYGSR